MLFQDRKDAGQALARAVGEVPDLKDALVLALPRGGVPVAAEVARALHLPLDIFVVRKLGTPGQEELAMGAIARDGTMVINRWVVDDLGISPETIEAVAKRERQEIERREMVYRNGHAAARIEGRTVILVDDGLATGATMLAAVHAVRPVASRVIVAVPVATQSICAKLRSEADEVICLATPEPFIAVGRFYKDFGQTTDDEVHAILAQARSEQEIIHENVNEEDSNSGHSGGRQQLPVQIPAGGVVLQGDLTIPERLRGVVLFAHGSGSSRHSPRNRHVAEVLQKAGLATLLMDLLTSREEESEQYTRHLRFDINLLAERLLRATAWIAGQPQFKGVKVGYFGASTGAAAALVAAAETGKTIAAVVSRGGRPDLAGARLNRVHSPTLLIVGGNDREVIRMNRDALALLRCEKKLEIVSGATHLFEEPGTLEEVARLARAWFEKYLNRNSDVKAA